MKPLMVAIGGTAGALARYWLGLALHSLLGSRFPFGTFVVNITGSFIVGFVMAVLGDQISASANWRLLIVVGFLGAYTTFSALEFETLAMIQSGRGLSALSYVVLSCVIGLAAVWLGWKAAQYVGISPDLASRVQALLTERLSGTNQS